MTISAWNAGKLVPAGSDIIVSLHYTTNGKPVTDRTKIGYTVANTPPAKKFLVQGAGEDTPVIDWQLSYGTSSKVPKGTRMRFEFATTVR